ncbi:hypothetical protein F3G61_32230, partial [Pseudomonas aeruginosa]
FTDKLSLAMDSCPNDTFIVTGDFNMRDIKWSFDTDEDFTQPQGISGNAQIYFFDVLAECNFYQFNYFYNTNNRVLDWVLSNSKLEISVCDDPLVKEDVHHKSLNIFLSLTDIKQLIVQPRSKYCCHSGNFESINSSLADIDWDSFLLNFSIDEAIDNFYNILY